MSVKKDVYELLQEIIDDMDLTVTIKTVTDNGDGTFTLTTCDTKHLQEGYIVTIGGNECTIVTVVNNTSVKVRGTDPITVTEFEAYTPHFFHGTVMATRQELDKLSIAEDKLPMIYLLEIIRERFNDDPTLNLDREADLRLFFLTQADFTNWDTDEHYRQAIKPMRNLADMFLDTLKEAGNIGLFDSHTLINHAKFGIYLADKGKTEKIFSENTSGCELQINIPFLRNEDCSC